MTLVHVASREVIAVHVLPVPALWQLIDADVFQVAIEELLSICQSRLELWASIVELPSMVRAGLGKAELVLWRGDVCIGNPGEASFVDGLGEEDALFFWHLAKAAKSLMELHVDFSLSLGLGTRLCEDQWRCKLSLERLGWLLD